MSGRDGRPPRSAMTTARSQKPARVHPDLVRPLPAGGKAHRGLADALDHRAEWLHYEALLTQNGAAA